MAGEAAIPVAPKRKFSINAILSKPRGFSSRSVGSSQTAGKHDDPRAEAARLS
jgi:hypothetical protein